MFFFKNNLAFGAFLTLVVGAIKIALDMVYKVLKVLKIQFLASVLFIGLILFITKVLPSNTTLLVIFFVFLFFAIVYAIYGNMKRIKKFFSVFHKEKKFETENNLTEVKEQNEVYKEEKKETLSYPKYYAVKQDKNYVMAEFSDRFELYLKKEGKLYKVRTDLKKENR